LLAAAGNRNFTTIHTDAGANNSEAPEYGRVWKNEHRLHGFSSSGSSNRGRDSGQAVRIPRVLQSGIHLSHPSAKRHAEFWHIALGTRQIAIGTHMESEQRALGMWQVAIIS